MTAVLAVEKATVLFGGLAAVQDVSLKIQGGQMVGFIGPNGAGKTTLMRAITGMVKLSSGRVLLDGIDLAGYSIDRRIRAGLALGQQIVKPLRAMTLLENVALACGGAKTRRAARALFVVDRAEEQSRARELLAQVGLGDVMDELPSTLPLGYLKRLEVARALALAPKLLLLDEPLAGLNKNEAAAVADLILGLNAAGQAILLIEHNLREVTRICDTLYVQDNGRALAFGETDSVMAQDDVRRAYLGVSGNA